MHTSVLAWMPRALSADEVRGKRVLEVGSYNVNGSVRPIVEGYGPALYQGVDQTPGPGVDLVVPCEQLPELFGGPDAFDVVISTEMLEHAKDWRGCLLAMAEVVTPGGLLLLTTRSPGFPYHPFPDDHWRFTTAAMAAIVPALGFEILSIADDPDPRHPGVFVKASKPTDWFPPAVQALDLIDAVEVTR